jgi:hypothetical protein
MRSLDFSVSPPILIFSTVLKYKLDTGKVQEREVVNPNFVTFVIAISDCVEQQEPGRHEKENPGAL